MYCFRAQVCLMEAAVCKISSKDNNFELHVRIFLKSLKNVTSMEQEMES